MEYQQTVNTFRSEITQDYLNAIIASVNYFVSIESKIEKLIGVDHRQQANQAPEIKPNESLCLSKVNYIAILTLEKLGISSPSETQIDIIETLILLANGAENITPEKLEICSGMDHIAQQILLSQFRKS